MTYLALIGSDGTLRDWGGELDREFAQAMGSFAPFELPDAIDHAFPLTARGETVGVVHLGIDRHFVQRQLDDILYDLVVILVVALLVTFEVMLVLVIFYVAGPLERLNRLMDLQVAGDFSRQLAVRVRDPVGAVAQYLSDRARGLHERYRSSRERLAGTYDLRSGPDLERLRAGLYQIGARFGLTDRGGRAPLVQAGVADIRIPLFIFAFAEELQKSFLPLFVRDLHTPVPWLSESMIISLPIVVYLAVLAIAAPFSGVWADRYGSRRIFLLGLAPAVAGYLGCALAQTTPELVLWRAVTALGYAMVTIACQSYVFGLETSTARARGIGVFIAVIMSATMCGTAIGGILAGGILARGMLTAGSAEPLARTTAPRRVAGWLRVLGNQRFVLFLLCVAIPTNVLVAAFLWYLVPLYLFDLGARPAEIARVMMLYYLIIVAAGPLVSTLIERFGRFTWVAVGMGSLLSGLGLMGLYDWPSIWGVTLAVVVMGAAHALAKAPQFGLALEICGDETVTIGRTTVLNVLRVIERVGMMLGLLLAAILVELYSYPVAIGITGLMV